MGKPEASAAPTRATAAFAVAAAAAARVAAERPASAAKAPPIEQQEDDDDDGDAVEQDSQMKALMQRTEELQRATNEASAAAYSQHGAQPAIMAKLSALIKEKDELEAQLRQEQAALEEELRSLQASKQ